MAEAVFGLIGVLVGSAISWIKEMVSENRDKKGHARYLAIRVVCILDQYVEQCLEVVNDDGLAYGQRNSDGCLECQVAAPMPPSYPEDVEWKSIDHNLMYRALSLPSETEMAARAVSFMFSDVASPPDYEEGFSERQYQYARLGVLAADIADDLRKKYDIPNRAVSEWDPVAELRKQKISIKAARAKSEAVVTGAASGIGEG